MIDLGELLAPVSTIQLRAAIHYWATDLPYSAWPNSPGIVTPAIKQL
jgi:hypothetical protein